MNRSLVSIKEVIEIVGLSKATIYRKIAIGKFPDSKKIGAKTVRWAVTDIESWLDGLSTNREVA